MSDFSPSLKGIQSKSQIIYFKGLNAFRFIAAFLVVLVHLDEAGPSLHSTFHLLASAYIGGLAVTFFFVLSGFLITYLLLEEKGRFHTIAVDKFYWRRILRIWPLYYLIVFLAFAVLNNPAISPGTTVANVYAKAPTNLLLYLALLPNVAWVSGLQIAYANQLWSVGVEEQFYLVWPLLARYFSQRQLLYFMLGLIGVFILTTNGLAFIHSHYLVSSPYLLFAANLLGVTRIDCMAIGGIGAYAYYCYPVATQQFISSRLIDILVAGLTFILVVRGQFIPYVANEVYGGLFCYIILSASCKPYSLLQLEGRLWNWLGRLSYGIYMWHMVVLGIMLFLLKQVPFSQPSTAVAVFYCFTPLATIIVAWLSYRYIEKPFLSIKKQFVLVKSSS